ncbi:MAG: hypothetical protein J5781_01345, partial [Clostridia bacterium]|nr:hypothetical protein [Clostridia bacterium]
DEQDDAALLTLLRRKIRDVNIALRECETPYERTRLRKQRDHYKAMLGKVETGSYNGDIIFSELKASAALHQEQALSSRAHASVRGGKIYNKSYDPMDFDYEAAFRKKRYFGVALPIFMTVLSLLLIAVFVIGFFLPSEINDKIYDNTGLDLRTYVVYRLGETSDGNVIDLEIDNDGNWPRGMYKDSIFQNEFVATGKPYADADENIPEKVKLNKDCTCEAIYIDTADIIKAWFRTKMLSKVRLDFIEDMQFFKGSSYYYDIFLSGDKADALVIKKDSNGQFDIGTIYNHIGVYGTIMFLIAAFLMSLVLFIINFIRIFTYTSRRIHGTTLFTMFVCLLAMISPALASCEGSALGTAFVNYFAGLNGVSSFVDTNTATTGLTIVFLLPAALCLVMMILPLLFKNRYKKLPTRLPKGNKIHDPFNRGKK